MVIYVGDKFHFSQGPVYDMTENMSFQYPDRKVVYALSGSNSPRFCSNLPIRRHDKYNGQSMDLISIRLMYA